MLEKGCCNCRGPRGERIAGPTEYAKCPMFYESGRSICNADLHEICGLFWCSRCVLEEEEGWTWSPEDFGWDGSTGALEDPADIPAEAGDWEERF